MAKAADIVGPITLTVLVKEIIMDSVHCSAVTLNRKRQANNETISVIVFFI